MYSFQRLYKHSTQDLSQYSGEKIELSRGTYKFECWGAQGGTGMYDSNLKYYGGKGAYVSGVISFKTRISLYLYIGGKGENGSAIKKSRAKGGRNGGGDGGFDPQDNDPSGGGGGSTDIRLKSGLWNDVKSLQSRIIVAAGGSGSAYNAYGAPGGDLNGYKTAKNSELYFSISNTPNQISGYSFGVGCNGIDSTNVPVSGGGGGYYGGTTGSVGTNNGCLCISSSGSSFVSGCINCVSVQNSTTIKPSSTNIHFSGYSFSNIDIHAGNQYMPSSGLDNQIGQEGDGQIRISKLSLSCSKFDRISSTRSISFISALLFQGISKKDEYTLQH